MKQEIHFVTGKGGVGKSIAAAALALKKSREGLRVLLVELGEQSFYRDFFALPEVGFTPVNLKPKLDVALWSGDTCLREYAGHLIKVQSLAQMFFDNAVMRAFINIAPALPELAILGKATSGSRKHGPPLPYDCLVIDSFATGHFLALLEAPKGMAQAVQFGPMGEQSRSIERCLRSPDICHYHIVTLPEELPIKEAQELADSLRSEFSAEPRLILNKVMTATVDKKTLASAKNENSDIAKFAEYLESNIERQSDMLERAKSISKNKAQVPLYFEMDPWSLVELVGRNL